MTAEYLLVGGKVVYTDDENVFSEEKKKGTCLIVKADSGFLDADGYVTSEEDLDELTEDYFCRVLDRHGKNSHVIFRQIFLGGEVVLREMNGSDYADFLRLCAQGGSGLHNQTGADYITDFEAFKTMSDEEKKLAEWKFDLKVKETYRILDYGLWIMEKNGENIGIAGLMPGERGVYLEYILDEAERGSGLMTGICSGIIHYAANELGIKKLFARINVDNHSSEALLRRLKFCQEEDPLSFSLEI